MSKLIWSSLELKENAHLERIVVKHLDKDSGGAARFYSRFEDKNEMVYWAAASEYVNPWEKSLLLRWSDIQSWNRSWKGYAQCVSFFSYLDTLESITELFPEMPWPIEIFRTYYFVAMSPVHPLVGNMQEELCKESILSIHLRVMYYYRYTGTPSGTHCS